MPARSPRTSFAHYAAPAAFLLGVTIAVLLIHSALGGGSGRTTTPLGPVTRPTTAAVPPPTHPATTRQSSTPVAGGTSVAGAQYTTVRRGDTFFAIATRSGTTVAAIEALNPGVSSNSLRIGQRIRVK